MLSWPDNSPDLTHIENVWATVKRQLTVCTFKAKQSLIEGLIQVWNHDVTPVMALSNLIKSMPTRLKEVIEKNRGHTIY